MKKNITERGNPPPLNAKKKMHDHGLLWIIGSYFLLGILAALLMPPGHVDSWALSEPLKAIPTLKTIALHGNLGHIATGYFLVMVSALPVAIALLLRVYRGTEWGEMSIQRRLGSLAFLVASAFLLAGFAFLLPPSHDYQGTKMRVLLYLAANYRLGLGLIMGTFFVSLALVVALASRAAASIAFRTHH